MNKLLFHIALLSATLSSVCLADEGCPRTVGASELGGWYGSESFAASLPARAILGSQRHVYCAAATLGSLVAITWAAVGWGFGPEPDLRRLSGMLVAFYVAAAMPLIAAALAVRLVEREEWLARSVVPPVVGFVGTLASVPLLLMVGCALTGDCL